MSWVSVDVETDGPFPGFGIPPMAKDTWGFSMVAIGAVLVAKPEVGFLGYLQPISERYDPEALAVSGFTRPEVERFPHPAQTMQAFVRWVKENAELPYIFIADNNGFDWMFTNFYLHQFVGQNLFGYSSKNINSLYHGLTKDSRASFKHLRKTKHDHNPMNDARGNAEALLYMRDEMGLKVQF